jgi:DNA topoisomerase VI subunit B
MPEARSNPSLPNIADVSAIGKKGIETLTAVQKEFLDAFGKANRTWASYLNDEAALATSFAKNITKATSVPEASAAYQELANQQMELLSRQAKKVFEDAQDFTKACSQLMGNGRGPVGT